MTERVVLPDPTDLDDLRSRLGGERQRPIGIRRIRIGRDVLDRLPDDVAEVRRPGDVLVVLDHTPMRRRDADLKATVMAVLSERFPTRRAVLGTLDAELHAHETASAELDTHLPGAGCIVAVGSGTITDLAKDASRRAGDIPFVVVQTAASVNAFSDDMAVLLRDGVKRTVPSRWPDIVIADVDVLAATPHAMHLAGIRRAVLDVHGPGGLVPGPRHWHGRRVRSGRHRPLPRRRRRPPPGRSTDAHR